MGWRVLKSGRLVVSDPDTSKKDEGWVTLLYDVYTKWMKLEVLETRQSTLPQISLVLKSNSVSMEFASLDPQFIVSVCIRNKMSCITLSYGRDTWHDTNDILEWQTLFKSAINPIGAYAVELIQSSAHQHALLLVNKRNIQLSVTELVGQRRRGSRDLGLNLVSTDIEGIKMTVEETILFSLNHQSVVLRTNRMIELYQHLMSYFTGRRNAVGSFKIAHFDYENVRRGSRDELVQEELVQEEDSPNGGDLPFLEHNIYVLPQFPRSPVHAPTRTPPRLPSIDQPKSPPLPPIAPHRMAKAASAVFSPKPAPPPKPKNAKQILSEFKGAAPKPSSPDILVLPLPVEPIYKTVYKRNVSNTSTGSLYAAMENLDDVFWDDKVTVQEDQAPELPPTPPQYMDHGTMLPAPSVNRNYGRKTEYENITFRMKNAPALIGSSIPPPKPIRSSLIFPTLIDEDDNEIDSEMYDSLYSMGPPAGLHLPEPVSSSSLYSLQPEIIPSPKTRKSIAVMQNIAGPSSSQHSHSSQNSHGTHSHGAVEAISRNTEKFLNRMHILEKKLAAKQKKSPISVVSVTEPDAHYYTGYPDEWHGLDVPASHPKKDRKLASSRQVK